MATMVVWYDPIRYAETKNPIAGSTAMNYVMFRGNVTNVVTIVTILHLISFRSAYYVNAYCATHEKVLFCNLD